MFKAVDVKKHSVSEIKFALANFRESPENIPTFEYFPDSVTFNLCCV
jgi:hypothetical protein